MNVHIKNMVCDRCKMVVKSELIKLGLTPITVTLGIVELVEDNIDNVKALVSSKLHELGFELIDDKKSRIIEQIKNTIINLVHYQNSLMSQNLSDIISSTLNLDYTYLSNLFSEVEGTTIEKYFIAQKIEKVKELLVYDEMSLSEIAFKLNYSSVAYLSNQFKKVTGLTPMQFKKIGKNERIALDKV